MRKLVIVLSAVFCFFTINSNAQKKELTLIVGGGRSSTGTGDMGGYGALNELDIPLSKHFSINPGWQFNTFSSFIDFDRYRTITTGVNIYGNFNYKPLNNKHHVIAIGAGAFVRFQDSNVPDSYEYHLNAAGEGVWSYYYYSPQKTTSVGYTIAPTYFYKISPKLSIGARLMLQNDTQEDIITSGFLLLGIKL